MDALVVEVTEQANGLLVTLAGELDDSTAVHVRGIEVSGTGRDLDIDLAGLEFMDSSGIGALVNLRNKAASRDMTTTVISAPPHIRHTFAVTGLAALFGLPQ